MRSDINTLEFQSNFSQEELKFIKDYFKFVKSKMNNPTHPEIHIGAARYPLGRFIVKKGLINPVTVKLGVYKDKLKSPERVDKVQNMIDCFNNLIPILDELRAKGKSVKSTKRKRLLNNEDQNNS